MLPYCGFLTPSWKLEKKYGFVLLPDFVTLVRER